MKATSSEDLGIKGNYLIWLKKTSLKDEVKAGL